MINLVENEQQRIFLSTEQPVQPNLTDITAVILDSDGDVEQSFNTILQSNTPGVYYIDVTLANSGDYILKFSSPSLKIVEPLLLKVVTVRQDLLALLTEILTTTQNIEICVDLIKKGCFNRIKIDEDTNELVLYDDDGVTELKRFPLFDINGNPAFRDIFEIGKAV